MNRALASSRKSYGKSLQSSEQGQSWDLTDIKTQRTILAARWVAEIETGRTRMETTAIVLATDNQESDHSVIDVSAGAWKHCVRGVRGREEQR